MALNRPPQPAECAFFTREYRSVPSPSVRRAIDQRFPKGDRYSNIDLLVGAKRQSDPIEAWHIQVDQPLFNRYVSEKKEDMIRQRTGVITSVLAPHSTALLISETGDTITGIEGVSF